MSTAGRREQVISLADVPALAVASGAPGTAAERGTILLLHGLTAAKEVQRTEAYSLADRGYLAVTIDAVGHGARPYADFDARFAADRGEASFFEIVRRTAAEIPAVLAALADLGWTHPGRVGACGISMGGRAARSTPPRRSSHRRAGCTAPPALTPSSTGSSRPRS